MTWQDFGTGDTKVSQLMTINSAGGVDCAGFNPGDWDGNVQCDGAEYITEILEHFRPPRFNPSWEKRVMIGQQGDTLEANESLAPVVLGLGEQTTSLQTLIANWSSNENAVAAFRCASTFKVFQIDRVHHDSQGATHKSRCKLEVEDIVLLPNFADASTTTYEYVSYVPMAVVYHKGGTGGGHIQAALRGGADHWWSTDDMRIAVPCPGLLEKIAKDIVQVWLVRSDQMGNIDPRPPEQNMTGCVREIVNYMTMRRASALLRDQRLKTLINTRCVLCGQWVFRFADFLTHLMHHHGQAIVRWPLYKRLREEMADYMPCRWCAAWSDDHDCLGCLQAVVALENFEDPYDAHDPDEEGELPLHHDHRQWHDRSLAAVLADGRLHRNLAAPPSTQNAMSPTVRAAAVDTGATPLLGAPFLHAMAAAADDHEDMAMPAADVNMGTTPGSERALVASSPPVGSVDGSSPHAMEASRSADRTVLGAAALAPSSVAHLRQLGMRMGNATPEEIGRPIIRVGMSDGASNQEGSDDPYAFMDWLRQEASHRQCDAFPGVDLESSMRTSDASESE